MHPKSQVYWQKTSRIFIFVYFMLNGKIALLCSYTLQRERGVGQMSHKQKCMDFTHLIRGITTGFREDITSQTGHFTSVEAANGGTTKWREETGQSGKVILDNPLSQLLSLLVGPWLC